MFLGLLTILLSVIADQFSKFVIDTQYIIDAPLEVCRYFNLVKVWNTGVSFSMFNDYGQAGTVVLSALSGVVSCGLLYWMWHETSKLKVVCLGLIIGGAIGNVIDRIRVGAVMDFLDFHYNIYHWPAFNLADTFICIGAVVLIFLEIKNGRKRGLEKI